MGWDFFCGTKNWTKKEFIEKMLNDFTPSYEIIKFSVKSSRVWTIMKNKKTDVVFIMCILTKKQGGDWGYKYISEFSHPFYYDCPISFLKLVSDTTETDALEWRRIVAETNKKPKIKKEYVIWGCPKNLNEEALLLTEYKNKKITDANMANVLMKHLEDFYKCTNCRIQEIEISQKYNPKKEFAETVNI